MSIDFAPHASNFFWELDEYPFQFRAAEVACGLNETIIAKLRRFAETKELFPAVDLRSGRTVYAQTKACDASSNIAAENNLRGVKMKGSVGVELCGKSGNWIARALNPHLTYGDPRGAKHLFVNRDLSVHTVRGKPKSWFTLAADAARQEFLVQTRLSKHGIAQRGIMWGEYMTDDGALRDLHQRPLGVSFTEHDCSYRESNDLWGYVTISVNGRVKFFPPPDGPYKTGEFKSGDELYDYPIKFLGLLGRTRRIAHLNAQVGRHSAHSGNLLYREVGDTLLLTDTDTCLLLDEIAPDLRAPQMLRDIARDFWHWIEEYMYRSCTAMGIGRLVDGQTRPFAPYLQSYFLDLATPDTIHRHAELMHAEFARWLESNFRYLYDLSDERIPPLLCLGAEGLNNSDVRFRWADYFLNVLPTFMVHVYNLMKESDLRSLGLVLPNISEAQLRENAVSGVRSYLQND